MEDVWEIIDLLIEEVKEINKEGNDFDITQSINAQLPFFTCMNNIIDKDIQKDIQRYVYCKDLSTSAYKGTYGEQPALWIDKYFIIKKAFSKLESKQIAKAKSEKK